MDFIDNTGHIFSLPQYDEMPIGYEYDENPYTFWIDSPNTNRLSVGNYYMRTIYFLVPYVVTDLEKERLSNEFDNYLDGAYNIEITIDSSVYSLVSTKTIQEAINDTSSGKPKSILDKVQLSSDKDIKNKLTNEDLYAVVVKEPADKYGYVRKYLLIPFYVVGNSKIEGAWSTNILIHVSELSGENYDADVEYWCPITVGGEWVEENEMLMINAQNMGINLPHDILRAIYQSSYDNSVFDEQLWNEKVKEYLLNYMGIRGELGNFNSAINSLNWFGYNDIIDVSALLRTDNTLKIQYVKDFFNISTDILESYKTFHNSALLSLVIKLNNEIGKTAEYDFSKDVFGEDNPLLEDLMDKLIPVKIGRNEPSTYWKTYYNFSFIELGLKLSALKYYYDKYFLPIHMSLNSATLQHKVYANDNKLINKSNEHYVEHIMYLPYKNEVEFPKNNLRYFTQELHFVDDTYSEYDDINETCDWYYINDSCINIPIHFKEYDTQYNCVLILEKILTTDSASIGSKVPDSNVIYETHFSFVQKENDPSSIYHDFVIYPKMIADAMLKRETNQLLRNELTSIYYWINSEFLIRLNVNNRWYTYRFTIKLPDLNINVGTLNYKYWEDDIQFSSKFRQLKKLPNDENDDLVFNAFMYEPQLVEVNNINFFKDFVKYLKLSEVQYISRDLLQNNSLIYYFDINGQRIAINKDVIDNGEDIYVPYKYLNEDNLFIFRYIDVTVFMNEEEDKILKVKEITENEPILITEEGYSDLSDYLVLKYDKSKDAYYANVNGDKIYVTMYEFLYNNIDNFIGDYSEQKNIVNSDKYKNQIHIFDLYRRNRHINNKLWKLHNDIDVRCKGIRFIHKNYIDNTLYIQGKVNSDYTNNHIDDQTRYDKEFNTHDDYTVYSIYWNDKLADYDNIDPKGFVYYIKCDRDGTILKDEYADVPITKGFDIDDTTFIGSIEETYRNFTQNYVNTTKIINNKNISFLQDKIIVDIKDDINGLDYSEVVFKFSFGNVIQNTDIEGFQNAYINGDSPITFDFYYKKYYTIQNIETEYNGEVFIKYKNVNGVPTNEIDYYYAKINNKIVRLTPYYDTVQYKDTLLGENEYDPDIDNIVLKNQPARHWYNIDTYEFNTRHKDDIDQVWVQLPGDIDPATYDKQNYLDDVSFKNYLETDVTSYIKKDNWYMLTWDAKITIGEEEQDWEGINLVLCRIRDNNHVILCNQQNMMLHMTDVMPNDKYLIFIQITDFPGTDGQIFRGKITPYVTQVYDQYDKLEYNEFLEEDENVIEYSFGDKTYKYGMNNSSKVKELYKEFFEMLPYEYTQDNITYKYDILSSKVNISNDIIYDQYLMHDDKYWYLVYISTQTIDKIHNIKYLYPDNKTIQYDGYENWNKNELSPNNTYSYDNIVPLNMFINGEFNDNYDRKYDLRLIASSKEFLPNRYWFKSANGNNHFDREDLIAAKIENNERLPINIHGNTKWSILPYSVDLSEDAISESNAEMIILDAPKNDNKYAKGYYTVNVKYSVSGYTTQQWSRNAMIRIE